MKGHEGELWGTRGEYGIVDRGKGGRVRKEKEREKEKDFRQ